MRASDFYDLVSGRRKGIGAWALRTALAAVEGPYRVGVWWRNRRYDTQPALTHRVEVPVVSIGNLTLGGSGKTPMVKWVCRRLREQGIRVSILSRGYGSKEGHTNDEALELEHALPDVPHLQNPDRVAMAKVAIEELATQALVLDDGFQHRRLGRDLDIVLIDATEPFGFGHVFPRGALREPVASLARADVICLTRSDLVDDSVRSEIRQRVEKLVPKALWCESIMQPRALLGYDSSCEQTLEEPIERLAGSRVFAFSGIGNPRAFHTLLKNLGAELVGETEFPDHHAYSREDVECLAREASDSGAEFVICTHKDLVKVVLPNLGHCPLRAVTIDSHMTSGEEKLIGLLKEIAQLAPADEELEI